MKNSIKPVVLTYVVKVMVIFNLLLICGITQAQNKKEQILALQNKIDSLISSHDKENTEHRTQIIELHSEIGKLKNEISAFQLKINTSKSTLENYQVQLKQKTDSLKNIQIQFDSITKNLFSQNKNFNYEDSTLLSFECNCPEVGDSENGLPLGWSNEGCFYYISSQIGMCNNCRNPDIYCLCPNDKAPKSIFSRADSALWFETEYNLEMINTVANKLIIKNQLLSNNRTGLIEDNHFPGSFKFSEIIEEKGKNGKKKYYLLKTNGNKQLIKEFNPITEIIDDLLFIYGDGEYTGYIKSPWNDTYILIFSYINYYTGFERENECNLDLIFLK
jgi:hypothetical protein